MKRWQKIFQIKELRERIMFVLGLLIIYRFLSSIPVPGVDVEAIRRFTSGNQIFQFFDLFSGGGFSNFSIVLLGIGPYITASIVMQLLTMAVPSLHNLYKEEGEAGRQKFNQYTRMLTVPLAIFQSILMINLFKSQGVLRDLNELQTITVISVITAGAVLLMWIGEIITEKNIGNGISLLIFAGIVSSLPTQIYQFILNSDRADIPLYLIYLGLLIAVIYAIIFVTEGQRNIPISYSKGSRGVVARNHVDTYLPLKVNQAGVMPIIFAVSVVSLPQMAFGFILQSNLNIAWLNQTATFINDLFQNQVFYSSMYFVMVILFTYLYTFIVFEPDAVSENLQRQGGFITGIRPGKKTSDYLKYVGNRIILFGAIFLGLIAILPFVVTRFTGNSSLAIGGTSLLIVVSVILETRKQIDSQIITRDYDSFK